MIKIPCGTCYDVGTLVNSNDVVIVGTRSLSNLILRHRIDDDDNGFDIHFSNDVGHHRYRPADKSERYRRHPCAHGAVYTIIIRPCDTPVAYNTDCRYATGVNLSKSHLSPFNRNFGGQIIRRVRHSGGTFSAWLDGTTVRYTVSFVCKCAREAFVLYYYYATSREEQDGMIYMLESFDHCVRV